MTIDIVLEKDEEGRCLPSAHARPLTALATAVATAVLLAEAVPPVEPAQYSWRLRRRHVLDRMGLDTVHSQPALVQRCGLPLPWGSAVRKAHAARAG